MSNQTWDLNIKTWEFTMNKSFFELNYGILVDNRNLPSQVKINFAEFTLNEI